MEVVDDLGKNDLISGDAMEAWLGKIALRTGRGDVEIVSKTVKKFSRNAIHAHRKLSLLKISISGDFCAFWIYIWQH